MTSNKIKLIACIAMFTDHLGHLVFPQYVWMRCVGRLAMPLFAFCIAEGCRYTRNRLHYFLRMFLLGALCQAVYAIEQSLSGGITSVYLNILFTFSLSALLCFAYLDYHKATEKPDKIKALLVSIGLFALLFLFDLFCTFSRDLVGISVTLDYGFFGVLLPVFALGYEDKKMRIYNFALGVFLLCASIHEGMPYIWFALLTLPVLWFYNGKRGDKKWGYAFYVFYPLHLAVIYGLQMLIK